MDKILKKETIRHVTENLSFVYEYLSFRKFIVPVAGVAAFYLLFVKRVGFRGGHKLKDRKKMSEHDPYDGEEHPHFEKNSLVISGWLMTKIFKRISVSCGDEVDKKQATPTRGIYTERIFIGKVDKIEDIRRKFKVDMFHDIVLHDPVTFHPLVRPNQSLVKEKAIEQEQLDDLIIESSSEEFRFVGISDLLTMYRKQTLTPVDVAKHILLFINDTQNIIIEHDEEQILTLAEESTRRWRAGKPLSLIDGIPVGVKDEYIVGGHHCRNGLPIEEDCGRYTVDDEKGLIKKLRADGALLIGITNMHQCGMGVFGINQSKYHGTPRNPYNQHHSTGGSSSGSAAAVASGLCTFALGTDGGGSIRLPAANCGVVGLKATYGRYSTAGISCNSSTVGHSGALCSSVRDTAIVYGVLAGPDNEDERSLVQPPVFLGNFENEDLTGIKIGIDWEWIDEANAISLWYLRINRCIQGARHVNAQSCEMEIRDVVMRAITWLETENHAEIVTIHFPEKEEMYKAHLLTIMSEMANTNAWVYEKHFAELNLDTQVNLSAGRDVSSHDYLQSARQRTRSMNALKFIFKDVDVLILPGINAFQPVVTSSLEKHGYLNNTLAAKLIELHALGNLTGVPSICLPVGYSQDNLPISTQIMASWWREDILFRISYALEKHVEIKKPSQHFNILEKKSAFN